MVAVVNRSAGGGFNDDEVCVRDCCGEEDDALTLLLTKSPMKVEGASKSMLAWVVAAAGPPRDRTL